MTPFEIFEIALGSGTLLSVIGVAFRSGRLVQKVENMEKNSVIKIDDLEKSIIGKVQTIENNLNTKLISLESSIQKLSDVVIKGFAKVDEEFKEQRKELSEVKTHLGILETRIDERTMKFGRSEKTGTGLEL